MRDSLAVAGRWAREATDFRGVRVSQHQDEEAPGITDTDRKAFPLMNAKMRRLTSTASAGSRLQPGVSERFKRFRKRMGGKVREDRGY